MPEVVGYARVSSTGQSLAVQLQALTAAECTKVFAEKKSGKTADRPELQKMLDYVREGDTVVITKLDRLGRSLNDLSNIVSKLEEQGVYFKVLDQSIDTSTPQGKLMFNMLGAFAEFELAIRYERQMAGIAKAKEAGVSFGRPVNHDPKVVLKAYEKHKTLGKTAKELGCSKSTVHRLLSSQART